MPTLDDVKAAIPEQGIATKELINMFKKRVGKKHTSYFVSLVARAGIQSADLKLIFPRKKLIVVLPVALPVADDKESLAKKKLIVVLPLRSL